MEEIEHFSHEHPLTSFVVKEVDDYEEDVKAYLCRICGLPILSSPSFTCSIDANCNFFLHKPCSEFPETILNHPSHNFSPSSKHTLYLVPKLPSGKNFTYECDKCVHCEIHPLVLLTAEIKTKHRSHQSHPLVAICREISSRCDGCGEEQKGFFFCCQECNFWIHRDCTLLPSVVKLPSHHPHPFLLTYSLPLHFLDGRRCVVCGRRLQLRRNIGVYFCGECFSVADPSCAKSSMANLETGARLGLIQLPEEADTTIFPSLVIRRYLQSNPLTQNDNKEGEYHKHPLILDDGISSSSTNASETCHNLMCDICIQPINISLPFYRCKQLQSDGCHFLAHDICADHLCRFKFLSLQTDERVSVCPDPGDMIFNSIFPCFFCHRPCNGLCYYLDDDYKEVLYLFDPECVVAPHTIKHASHRQHVLFQTRSNSKIPLGCCSGECLLLDVYKCLVCDFYIHIRCALLPKSTQHKFDQHPLELIIDHNSEDHFFCEFCEENIDHKYWYYGCRECEHYFHINCIPSVGYLSKVKFGKTLVDNNIHPDHPLTLTRMITVGRHERCGYCNKIIKGFVDEMAFSCSECDFWIHFSCARDSLSARLRTYSEVEEEDRQYVSRFILD